MDQSQGLADGGGRDLGLHHGKRPAVSGSRIIAAVSLVVSIFSTLTWAAFGAGIRRWLRSHTALRLFNIAMALSLVASMAPILLEIAQALK